MLISLVRPLPNDAGWVSQWFGETERDYSRFGLVGHNGIDYAAPMDTPVLAAHAGTCAVGYDEYGYGNFVRIIAEDIETIYGHLNTILIEDKQSIEAGTQVGMVGSTGNSTGPHLHFGLKLAKGRNPGYRNWIDPVPFRDI